MRLHRAGLAAWLVLGILFAPLVASAGQQGRVPRIGYFILPPLVTPPSAERQAFLQGLRELGYEEGKSIIIEHRSAAWNRELLQDLAAELVDLKVDLIVVQEPTVQAAKDATKTIPIVMAASADPVGTGIVASLPRPGGNITGLSFMAPELGPKRLELLKEAVPKASRVAVLWNSTNRAAEREWKTMKAVERRLGLTLQSQEITGADDFMKALSTMSRRRPHALITVLDPLTSSYRQLIAEFGLKAKVPTMFGQGTTGEMGGLMSYAPNVASLYRRAAWYVDKILKGAKPADLPVEQPTLFELIVNMKTAKALGLTLPQSILIRADHVVQ